MGISVTVCTYICDYYIDMQGCSSCEELESKLQFQQKEIESLQRQLNYWQNTTINIFENYPIDGLKIIYMERSFEFTKFHTNYSY